MRSPFLLSFWNNEGKLVIYNYNKNTMAVVSNDVMKIIDTLSQWRNTQQISDQLNIDKKDLTKALEHLVRLKLIHKNRLTYQDMQNDDNMVWDPIDLAMQRQRSYGGRFPMSKRHGKSPSPTKNVKGISSFVLPSPDNIDDSKSSLLKVLDERRSIRRYGSRHVSVGELSYLLYHSARIKEIFRSKEGTLTKRPYPSGGARYPLEIYVVNNRIRGLQRGIHYYDPLKHKLNLIHKNNSFQKRFNRFIMDVQHPLMNREPDVLFIITAVFARTMWKYEKLGLSLILSDLGCLYQTMYLIATELKLAPCPIGKTEEEIVKKWLNLNWFEESHVGTFILGVPKDA
jgi:SagB-type dehydrogenase family enzyme